jgi:prepilin-type processing-associated H-X9-DG protein
MLLPAIQMAREAARKATCSNNLRNLALAVQQFDTNKGYVPASRTYFRMPRRPPQGQTVLAPPAGAVITWVHEILPFIERDDLYNALETASSADGALANIKLTVVFCPSDELDGTKEQASYACNSGLPDNFFNADDLAYGVDWDANGVFDTRIPVLPGTQINQQTVFRKFFKTTLGRIPDGTTNTLMLAENVDVERWHLSGWDDKGEREFNLGLVWQDNYWDTNPIAYWRVENPNDERQVINKEKREDSPGRWPWTYARPSSNHSNGFNAAFCDGSVRFVSELIDYTVYARLMTSEGKKYKQAGRNTTIPATYNVQTTPLSDGDY